MKKMCSACGKRPKQDKNHFLCTKCSQDGERPVFNDDLFSPKDPIYLHRKMNDIIEEYRKNPPVPTKVFSAKDLSQEELQKLIPSAGYPVCRKMNEEDGSRFYG